MVKKDELQKRAVRFNHAVALYLMRQSSVARRPVTRADILMGVPICLISACSMAYALTQAFRSGEITCLRNCTVTAAESPIIFAFWAALHGLGIMLFTAAAVHFVWRYCRSHAIGSRRRPR